MASISPTTLQCSAEPHSGKNAYLKLTITSISDSDASTNKRYVGWKITVEGTPWSALKARYATLGGHEIRSLNTTQVTNWSAGQQLDSGNETYDNDSAGNLTLYAYLKQLFYYSYSDTRWNNSTSQAADANMVCSQLPRYANLTKYEIGSIEINKFTINWNADAACDAVQYSLNGGSWTNTSGLSFSISGLTPGQQYNIRIRVKRTDSQLWTTSGYLYPTCKSLPTTNTPSNFNLGSNLTASISSTSNLSKWYCDVYDGSTKIASSGDVTSTSKTITLTNSTLINNMLARHHNDNSWTITVKYYCVSNGTTYTLTQRTCTCTIPSGQYTPTFSVNNLSYEVTDSQSLNLTGSNKKVIKGISDILVTISPASPNGSASMVSYNANSGNSTGSTTNISSPTISLNNVTANSVTVQAVDSRTRTTNATKNYDAFIDYFAPTISSASVNRIDGVSTNLAVNITGRYCNWSGLSTTNIIEQVSIQYKLKSASTYTTISGINLNITNTNGTFTITGNITGNYFDVSNEYDVLLTFKDKINNLPYHASIHTGEAILWRDTANKRIGIGKKPTKMLDIAGNAGIDGQLLKNAGSSWVKDRDVAPVRNNNTNQGGAYYSVVSQKTKNGNWTIGQLSGEDLLSFNYTTDTNYNNNNNTSARCYLKNGDTGRILTMSAVYPVGAIYISAYPTSPASLFGGTWTQLKNHFLFATNATSGNKGKDASSSHTGTAVTGTKLTAAQSGVPAHNHGASSDSQGSHNHEVYVNGDTNFPLITYPGWTGGQSGRGANVQSTYNGFRTYTGYNGGHSHGITVNNNTAKDATSTHNHTVSSIEVYVWQRTA